MDNVDALIAQLSSDDPVTVYQADFSLQRMVSDAGKPGAEADRKSLAESFAAALALTDAGDDKDDKKKGKKKDDKKDAKKPPSVQACRSITRHLALVADDAQVPVLKRALQDLEIREMARWALERMNSAAATDALIEAATTGIGTEFRIGAIAALGHKSGHAVTKALADCCKDDDPQVCIAAAEALSNHADATNDVILALVARGPAGGQERSRRRIGKARIRLAENLARAGHGSDARKVYESILADTPDEPQRNAAQKALQKLG